MLSEETHERRFAVCGLNTALYVQLPTGSVSSERGDVGDHYHPAYNQPSSRTAIRQTETDSTYQLHRPIPARAAKDTLIHAAPLY